MKILNIAHRDVYVTAEFSLEQLKKIRAVLEVTEIKFDHKEEKELTEATEYVIKEFYPEVDKLIGIIEEEM